VAAAAGPAEPAEVPATGRKRRRVHYVNCACGSPDGWVDFELEKGFCRVDATLFDSHVAPIAQGGNRATRAALAEAQGGAGAGASADAKTYHISWCHYPLDRLRVEGTGEKTKVKALWQTGLVNGKRVTLPPQAGAPVLTAGDLDRLRDTLRRATQPKKSRTPPGRQKTIPQTHATCKCGARTSCDGYLSDRAALTVVLHTVRLMREKLL
jgi:hypothetical protein